VHPETHYARSEDDLDHENGAVEVPERLDETVVKGSSEADPRSSVEQPPQRGDRVTP
jgi:hypothetical protein